MIRTRGPWLYAVAVAALCAVSGCAPSADEGGARPFFQHEYATTTHGRKTFLDHVVEADPGGFTVDVVPDYLVNPPARVAVLPFADLGSANLVIDKIPLTFRNQEERAAWAWTDAQRLRRAMNGYLAGREFLMINPIAIDAVLRAHGVKNYRELRQVPSQAVGRWLGADAVVYGEVTHYEGYYAFLISAWQVGVKAQIVSTRDGHTLINASGNRFDVTLAPAIDIEDMAINSGLAMLELRDINLARAEDEACREIVRRIPVSEILRDRLQRQALEYDELERAGTSEPLAPPQPAPPANTGLVLPAPAASGPR